MKLTDAIKEKISIVDYAERIGLTPVRHSDNRYTLKEHESCVIHEQDHWFVWNSGQVGGSVIDFAMTFGGLSKDAAIEELKRLLNDTDYSVQRSSRPPPRLKTNAPAPVTFPPAVDGPYKRVFAYLAKTRCIEPAIINDMIQRKFLYEDDHHNCVFIGRDYDGVAKYGFKRGTSTEKPFRGELLGTNEFNKQVGLHVDNHADKLFVSEAAIDNLSIMTLLHRNGRDPRGYNYLSLGGTYVDVLKYHITRPENSGIKGIYIATDNDPAGMAAREELRSMLARVGYTGWVRDKIPVSKDWNQDLQNITAAGRRQPIMPSTIQKGNVIQP